MGTPKHLVALVEALYAQQTAKGSEISRRPSKSTTYPKSNSTMYAEHLTRTLDNRISAYLRAFRVRGVFITLFPHAVQA